MNANPELNRLIQRGPPNMFNLPDMFREIAESLRRAFRRARARRRQGTCSILQYPSEAPHHTDLQLMGLAAKRSHRTLEQGGPAEPYNI